MMCKDVVCIITTCVQMTVLGSSPLAEVDVKYNSSIPPMGTAVPRTQVVDSEASPSRMIPSYPYSSFHLLQHWGSSLKHLEVVF